MKKDYSDYTYQYLDDSTIHFKRSEGDTTEIGLIVQGQQRTRPSGESQETYEPWLELINSGIEIEPIDLLEVEEKAKAAEKAAKIAALNVATVDIDGLVFQANELSRSRMLSAIITSETVNETSTTWKMADNTESVITLDQLKQAHAKATRLLSGAVLEGGE